MDLGKCKSFFCQHHLELYETGVTKDIWLEMTEQ